MSDEQKTHVAMLHDDATNGADRFDSVMDTRKDLTGVLDKMEADAPSPRAEREIADLREREMRELDRKREDAKAAHAAKSAAFDRAMWSIVFEYNEKARLADKHAAEDQRKEDLKRAEDQRKEDLKRAEDQRKEDLKRAEEDLKRVEDQRKEDLARAKDQRQEDLRLAKEDGEAAERRHRDELRTSKLGIYLAAAVSLVGAIASAYYAVKGANIQADATIKAANQPPASSATVHVPTSCDPLRSSCDE